MEFLKKFGIGILYAVFFPALLVIIALVAIYGVLVFLVEFVIMLINFFSGRKCFPVFPEDEEATKRKQEALKPSLGAATIPKSKRAFPRAAAAISIRGTSPPAALRPSPSCP